MSPGTDAADIALEPLGVEHRVALLHRWLTHPRSRFWQMQDASLDDVAAEYRRIAAHPHHHAWLGSVDGTPMFLAETYDPLRTPEAGLADLPELRAGDLGMHVLVAPPEDGRPTIPGLTRAVFHGVMTHCFADPSVERVVVEPDVRNRRIRRLNAEAGFAVVRVVALPADEPARPGKTAAVSLCTREAFARSPLNHERTPA